MAISGQNTVAAAGTAEQLGTAAVNGPLMVKALDTNTDIVAIGNNGADDVDLTNGMRLAAGDSVVFAWVGNLGSIWVDSAVNGEGVAWLSLDV